MARRDGIPSAPGSPDDGFRWVLKVEKKSYEDLFPTLDAKLAVALSKAMTGELGCQINLRKEHAAKKEQYLRGRHILSMLYDDHRVSETDGAILEFQDLFNVEMRWGEICGLSSTRGTCRSQECRRPPKGTF